MALKVSQLTYLIRLTIRWGSTPRQRAIMRRLALDIITGR